MYCVMYKAFALVPHVETVDSHIVRLIFFFNYVRKCVFENFHISGFVRILNTSPSFRLEI